MYGMKGGSMQMYVVGKTGKFLFSILSVCMLLAGLSACSQSNTISNQKPVTIGFTVSLTGDFSADGQAVLQGYELWRDSINQRGGLLGRPVALKYYDDGSDVNRADADYEKLITGDHVDLVFGPFSTKITTQVVHVADKYDYAFIVGAGNGAPVFQQQLQHKNLFVSNLPSETYLDSFSEFLLALPQDMRPKTVAYVRVDDPFAIPQVNYAQKILARGGLKAVYDNQKPLEDGTADISTAAKAVAQSQADVVVFGTVGVDDCVSFIKAFRQLGYNPKAFIATSGPDEGSAFSKAVGMGGAEGVFVPNSGWYPGVNTYQNAQFAQEYLAKYGGSAEDINSGTVQGYSVGQLLEQAVSQSHSLDNKVLIKTLHEGTFNDLFGPIRFNDQGANIIGVPYLFQWQAGKLIPVYPSSQAQANPEYPKDAWSNQ
jgi:branched-chain amino acid transport system substrate-binding protein